MINYSYIKGLVYKATLHDGITATATSNEQKCAGAKAIGLQIIGDADVSDRTLTLTVTVSMDGINYKAYSMLIDNTANSNGQQLTRVASKAVNSNTSEILWFTPETLGAIAYFKAVATINDGGAAAGTFDVKSLVQY